MATTYYKTASGVLVMSDSRPEEVGNHLKVVCYRIKADGSKGGCHGLLKLKNLTPAKKP